jgi:hypothetical protein
MTAGTAWEDGDPRRTFKKIWTPEEDAKLIDAAQTGTEIISADYGCSKTAVSIRLTQLGLGPRNKKSTAQYWIDKHRLSVACERAERSLE